MSPPSQPPTATKSPPRRCFLLLILLAAVGTAGRNSIAALGRTATSVGRTQTSAKVAAGQIGWRNDESDEGGGSAQTGGERDKKKPTSENERWREFSWNKTAAEDALACLDQDGPQPYVLMSLGRSGSGSTWQVIGNLTGRETPSVELTGSNEINTWRFFERVGRDENMRDGSWIVSYMCLMQQKYPQAGAVGFKWKPFESTMYSEPAQGALQLAVASAKKDWRGPIIKVVRSRRNLLDVLISCVKHRLDSDKVVRAHCYKGDQKCLEVARSAATGISLPMHNVLDLLRNFTKSEDKIDKMLRDMGVPHVAVTYERLYNNEDPKEWMKIFRFLGVGPGESLKWEDVEKAMGHVSTSNRFHNVTLKNYQNVAEILRGTEFEGLLHRR